MRDKCSRPCPNRNSVSITGLNGGDPGSGCHRDHCSITGTPDGRADKHANDRCSFTNIHFRGHRAAYDRRSYTDTCLTCDGDADNRSRCCDARSGSEHILSYKRAKSPERWANSPRGPETEYAYRCIHYSSLDPDQSHEYAG